MNTHLSEEQIFEVLIGSSNSVPIQHGRACTECAAGIERLELPLADVPQRSSEYRRGQRIAAKFETRPVLTASECRRDVGIPGRQSTRPPGFTSVR